MVFHSCIWNFGCYKGQCETLAIEWPIDMSNVVTSDKDLKGKSLNDAELFV